jgi:hypothetical protein
MTCIVGIVEKRTKSIYIGGDSAGVAGLSITHRKDPKVFINNGYIIGFTSSFRMGQLLMFSNLPEYNTRLIPEYEFMVRIFIPFIKTVFEENGYAKQYEDGEAKGGTFLVGFRGKLFVIEDDYQVGENFLNYASVGCGSDLALGALYASDVHKPAVDTEQRVITALEAAAKFSGGVVEPYKILKLTCKKL